MRARSSRAISRPRRPFCATRRGWVGALGRGGPSCPPRLGTRARPPPRLAPPPRAPALRRGSAAPLAASGSRGALLPPSVARWSRRSPLLRRSLRGGARVPLGAPAGAAPFGLAPGFVPRPGRLAALPAPGGWCRPARARARYARVSAPRRLPRGGSRPLRGLGGSLSAPPRVGLVRRGFGAARVLRSGARLAVRRACSGGRTRPSALPLVLTSNICSM